MQSRMSVPQSLLHWDKLITGAAVTSVTTNGEVTLDGNAHGGYFFDWIFVAAAGTPSMAMYYNNDQVITNYNRVVFYIAWYNDAYIHHNPLPTSATIRIVGSIEITANGFINAGGTAMSLGGSTAEGIVIGHNKKQTVTNLTRIDIVSNVANSIGINSRFRLWRRI